MDILQLSFLLIGIAMIGLLAVMIALTISVLRMLWWAKIAAKNTTRAISLLPKFTERFVRRGLIASASTQTLAYFSKRLMNRKGEKYAEQ